ncbi:MAG: DUF1565 domain-containing protein [Actinobacteria bacterium]|uniref:Unannotated protein n=1 Tax=freshwater metagenome TaxID=449393 RepID=A0A6J7ELS1_9ZZZZ|nr:DUF1565 domain-containing protein [Actinomycetota bacterium]
MHPHSPLLRPKTALASCVIAAVFIAASAAPSVAATRTWVSGVGDDANPCSRTAPCKTWAGAISKTDAGGVIDALDPGGFGAVTITKAITLDGSAAGGQAGTLVSSGMGVTISAGVNDRVTLRHMVIEGLVQTGSPGQIGVVIWGAGSVLLDDVEIHQFLLAGIYAAPLTGHPAVTVVNSTIADNTGPAIDVNPADGAKADVIVQGCTITTSSIGIQTFFNSRLWYRNNTIFANGFGVDQSMPGQLHDLGGNSVVGNTKAAKFHAVPSSVVFTGRRGKGIRAKFASTLAGTVTLRVIKSGHTLATIKGKVAVGAGSIVWNGKAGKTVAAKGTYTLAIAFKEPTGQTANYSIMGIVN